jgi:uncharacterized delta-60 repeat protein
MKKPLLFLTYLFLYSNFTSAQVTQEWVALYNGPADSIDASRSIALDGAGNIYVCGWSMGIAGTDTTSDYATIKYNQSGVQQWIQRYNGPGNGPDNARSIAVDLSGNVYVTGASLGSGTDFDYTTIKYNTQGIQQWVQRYNGTFNGSDEAWSIVLDNAGNAYVTGRSRASTTGPDYVTIKYNSAGVPQWVQVYSSPGNNWDEALDIAIDSLDNICVTGLSFQPGTWYDIATVKYNASGVQQWVSRFNGLANWYDVGYTIAADAMGNIYIAGYTTVSGTTSDYVVIKYLPDGFQQWVQTYNGPGNSGDVAYSLASDGVGNTYVTGHSQGNGTGGDYATIKYNASGTQQWVQRYNGTANDDDVAWWVAADFAGNVYVTGWSAGVGTDLDIATIKYSPIGMQQWIQRYNGSGNVWDGGSSLVIDNLGNVFVTGRSTGLGSDQDYVTIKYSQSIGISPISSGVPDKFALYQNYPNPFNPVTKIKFDIPGAQISNLCIYDILGREITTLVNESLKTGTYEVEWDAADYPSGVYYYKLIAGDFIETKKMVLIK